MIEELRLRNFKAFQEVEIALTGLNLLVGANGAGKSSVLQSIAVLKQSIESGAVGSGQLMLNGELANLGTGRDVLHDNPLGDPPRIEIALAAEGVRASVVADYSPDADQLALYSSTSPWPEFAGLEQCTYIRADRLSPSEYYPYSYDSVLRKHAMGPRGEFAASYLQELGDSPVASGLMNAPDTGRSLLEQTSAWLGEICPGVDLAPHRIANTNLIRLDYGFGGSAGLGSSNRYRPTNIGFGISYALPIIVACLVADSHSILLLENPEAHLHPRGQSRLGELLCRVAGLDAQVVVETHSDHLLNGVRLGVKRGLLKSGSASCTFFTSENGVCAGIEQIGIDSSGRLSSWPAGFFDEEEAVLSQLLY